VEPAQHLPYRGEDYECDYHAWLEAQAVRLRAGDLHALDALHLAEEVEDMGRRERQALASNLVVVLLHLLKYRQQPERRSNSWLASIREHRRRLRRQLQDSPSLRAYAREIFAECYADAREQAADETGLDLASFPETSPFDLAQALDKDFLPDA
jgi:hypothetical protein